MFPTPPSLENQHSENSPPQDVTNGPLMASGELVAMESSLHHGGHKELTHAHLPHAPRLSHVVKLHSQHPPAIVSEVDKRVSINPFLPAYTHLYACHALQCYSTAGLVVCEQTAHHVHVPWFIQVRSCGVAQFASGTIGISTGHSGNHHLQAIVDAALPPPPPLASLPPLAPPPHHGQTPANYPLRVSATPFGSSQRKTSYSGIPLSRGHRDPR